MEDVIKTLNQYLDAALEKKHVEERKTKVREKFREIFGFEPKILKVVSGNRIIAKVVLDADDFDESLKRKVAEVINAYFGHIQINKVRVYCIATEITEDVQGMPEYQHDTFETWTETDDYDITYYEVLLFKRIEDGIFLYAGIEVEEYPDS